MLLPSKPACAPTPANSVMTKSAGASSDSFTTSITKNIPASKTILTEGNAILAERGVAEDIRRAIMSHAEYTGVTRDSNLEKALFACDELAGFITATALVKPNKSLAEVDAKSVRKRMKDKAFARAVSREDIIKGAAELGVDLDEHIAFCIEAMRGIAGELGLAGKNG